MDRVLGFDRWTAGHPRTVVITLVLCTVAFAWFGLPRMRIDPDVSRMLPPDSPSVQLHRVVEGRVAASRLLLVLARGPLASLERELPALGDRLRALPSVTDVAVTRDELLGEALAAGRRAPPWTVDAATLDALQELLSPAAVRRAVDGLEERMATDPIGGVELAVADPLGVRHVLRAAKAIGLALPAPVGSSELLLFAAPDVDGDYVGVLRLTGRAPSYDVEFARALLDDVAAAAQPVAVELFGGYVIAEEQARRMRHDMTWSTSGSMLLVGVYLAWVMRSLLAPLLVLLPTVLAVLWALAIGAFAVGTFNVLAVGAAAVLVGLGVDFAIHWLARFDRERSRGELLDPVAVVARTRRAVAPALLAGVASTCGAFLSLAFGEFQGLWGFGVLLSVGLVVSLALTFVLLPAVTVRRRPMRAPTSLVARALERAACGRYGARLAWVALACALLAVGTVAVRGLPFEIGADATAPADSQALRMRETTEALIGMSPFPVVVLLPADRAADLAQGGVRDLLRRGAAAFVDGPLAALPDAERRARVASFAAATDGWDRRLRQALADVGFDPAPFEAGIERLRASMAAPPPTIAERYRVQVDGVDHVALFCHPPRTLTTEAQWQSFRAAAQAAFGEHARPFSTLAMMTELRSLLVRDLLRCGLVAAALAALLAVVFGGGAVGLLVLLPVACGLAWTLGLLAWFGVSVTLANFIAFPFLIGIGLDDGMHLLHRVRQHGLGSGFGPVGVAMWRTSVTTGLAFGSLATVDSPGLASLGGIVACGVVGCVVATFLVLGPALAWLLPDRAGAAAGHGG